MIYTEKDFEQGIEIISVDQYMSLIKKLQTDNNDTVLFRGQETDFWNVWPSIFRDNLLSIEHILMKEPLLKIPHDFKTSVDMFDILTKYQHYNMCTRLLDLTTNPLVALYFACKQHGNEQYRLHNGEIEEKEPNGIIYYNKAFPITSENVNVRIIIGLARMDLESNNTFGAILQSLYEDGIISEKQMESWLTKEHYSEFIDILQSNYFVSPTYSNERLSKQSGMFLLAGCFSVVEDEIPANCRISKGTDDLKDEFNEEFFYIDGKNKEIILKELDIYNINEASLFPELEHQLNYIKVKSKERTKEVSSFVKLTNDKPVDIANDSVEIIKQEVFEKAINDKIIVLIQEKELRDKTLEIAINNFNIVDWHKRDTILSQFRTQISKLLIDNKYSSVEAKICAAEIVKEAVGIVNNNVL